MQIFIEKKLIQWYQSNYRPISFSQINLPNQIKIVFLQLSFQMIFL